MEWLVQEKHVKNYSEAVVSVRRGGFGFNKHFVERFGVENGSHAEIFFSKDGTSVGLKFGPSETKNSYLVTQDGGSRGGQAKKGGLYIACGNVVKSNPSLLAMSKDSNKQKAKALFDKESGVVFFYICPVFNKNLEDEKPAADECGVYRYTSDGEVVYIGQGNLSQRFRDPTRSEWVFNKIEYMVVFDPNERQKIEAAMLADYAAANSRLPLYNRIKGRSFG